jgi:hypothetical protein
MRDSKTGLRSFNWRGSPRAPCHSCSPQHSIPLPTPRDWARAARAAPHPHSRPRPPAPRAQGDVVEGSESEIRAAIFVLALVRQWDAATGSLSWKVAEVAMHGSQLYL